MFLQRYFTKHDFFGWFLGVNGGGGGGGGLKLWYLGKHYFFYYNKISSFLTFCINSSCFELCLTILGFFLKGFKVPN